MYRIHIFLLLIKSRLITVAHKSLVHRLYVLKRGIGAYFSSRDNTAPVCSEMPENIHDMIFYLSRRAERHDVLPVKIRPEAYFAGKVFF